MEADQAGREWPLSEDGVWIEVRRGAPAHPGPVLFLDRDGVIIEDRGYVYEPGNVVLIPSAAALIAEANARAVPVAVATNQSGIDRGLFGWDGFAAVQDRIDGLLAAQDARIDALAACPFHPDHTPAYGARHDAQRKPAPGMIVALAARLGADLARSWMVGDTPRDIEAARRAGLAGAVLFGAAPVPGDAGPSTGGGFSVHACGGMDAVLGLLRRVLFDPAV